MEAQTEAKCAVSDSAVITYGARSGNCSGAFPILGGDPEPVAVPSASLGFRILLALILLLLGVLRSPSARCAR